ncbi:hypothetical protein Mmc1_0155 [Magnetococcus marinus MC-1]|uniref:Hemerythrin-like domain-containing protein n=1 Tax=Magnetococcus marinus (strain ATCC BAA-1437 / JCM 17883 / MC-1) TaxID=156889 RepID=A0L3Y9_MAGMM|nr:hypothetical protein [Magnetococcus marinus]ABK42682.1 hypothetical protein Mmc1_0155 [Magnetococcus marinus MC-1]
MPISTQKHSFINLLQAEHHELLTLLDAVDAHGVEHPFGFYGLQAAEQLIKEHLLREIEFLYPFLRQSVAHDAQLIHELVLLETDMKSILHWVELFFETYAHSTTHENLKIDYQKLKHAIQERIQLARERLLPLYQELTALTPAPHDRGLTTTINRDSSPHTHHC